MDFSHCSKICSDIDMFHLTKCGLLIIGEIKNSKGEFKSGQRSLLEKLVDKSENGGAVIFITHNQDVHNGDKTVDTSRCNVQEYYWKGKWREPKQMITVNEVLNILEEVKDGKRND